MTCPNCGDPLHHRSLAGLSVDVCGRCGGIWFDEGELAEMVHNGTDLSAADSQVRPADKPDNVSHLGRLCPKCATGLESYRYLYSTPVVLDSCPRCGGIFVEDGELAGIAKEIEDSQKPANAAVAARLVADELDAKTRHNMARAIEMTRAAYRNRMAGQSWWDIDGVG